MAERKTDNETGAETTGHEWDGISELNKPLPKWWLWTFYATIIWSVGYWVLMPTWPLVSSYTKGYLSYSQREKLASQLADAKAAKAIYREKIAASDLATINADPELLQFALAGGEAAFAAAGEPDRVSVLKAAERDHPAAFRALVVSVLADYCESGATLAALGWLADPPQPRGHDGSSLANSIRL